MEPNGFRGEFFDYDPLTGLHERYEETPDGKVHIHTYQDVEPYMDAAKRIANSGTADDAWKMRGVTNYAIIPPIIQGHMLKRGINFMDQNDIGKVVREMNTTYSNFKLTHKHHEVK
jgi:hypothetical protein